MIKIRSQTRNIAIKKEEEDCKPTLVLHSVRITQRTAKRKAPQSNSSDLLSQQVKVEEKDYKPPLVLHSVRITPRITKRKPSKNRNSRLSAQQVKVEEDTDTKSLLQSTSNHSKRKRAPTISQEQINQLIDYIVNHGMGIPEATRKANMRETTARYYYNVYKNDPEKKIPSPRNRDMNSRKYYTQKQIETFIRYIENDKISIVEASVKANIIEDSARRYYKKYLKDPNHNIPVPYLYRNYTQVQRDDFIGYIINDKMSIKAAARKAKMGVDTAYRHYHKYFGDQNPKTTTPSHVTIPKRYTQKQIKDVISYIENDKMTIRVASRKANMGSTAASRYYQQYINSPNNEVPLPGHIAPRRYYTQEQIKELISYIVDDKMSISAASIKANIAKGTAVKLYQQYFKDQNMEVPVSKFRNRYTQDQIDELNRYITDDKMTKLDAAKKLNIPYSAGKRHSRQYVKN